MPVNADAGVPAPVITPAPGRTVPPIVWWTRDFPGGQDQVSQARHWIEDLLPQCDPLDDLVLLASELCANAVVHTRSGQPGGMFTIDVEWAPQSARVVIGDQGSPVAPTISVKAQDATWSDECGRGLWLVDELADDWGTASCLGCRWVWAEMRWQAKGGPLLQASGGHEAVRAGIAVMREAFPGAAIWWGHRTQAWQAALPGAAGASGLVSAATRGELCQLLAAIDTDSRSAASPGGDHAR